MDGIQRAQDRIFQFGGEFQETSIEVNEVHRLEHRLGPRKR